MELKKKRKNKNKKKFVLPDTNEEIRKRFNKLFVEFVRKKKHENQNELGFYGMLCQSAITPRE